MLAHTSANPYTPGVQRLRLISIVLIQNCKRRSIYFAHISSQKLCDERLPAESSTVRTRSCHSNSTTPRQSLQDQLHEADLAVVTSARGLRPFSRPIATSIHPARLPTYSKSLHTQHKGTKKSANSVRQGWDSLRSLIHINWSNRLHTLNEHRSQARIIGRQHDYLPMTRREASACPPLNWATQPKSAPD